MPKLLNIVKKSMLYIYLPVVVIISLFTDSGAFCLIAAAEYILITIGCDSLLKKYFSESEEAQKHPQKSSSQYFWTPPVVYDILFGDSSTTSGFLPEREPGEYRVIWEGYARPTNSSDHVSDGTLIATFTLE